MTVSNTPFPGVLFPEHAPKFVLPGLSLRQLRTNKALISEFLNLESKLTNKPSVEDLDKALDAAVRIGHLALKRNYPAIMEDEVGDLVDMNNLQFFVRSIMGASGFKLVTSLPEEVAGVQAGELGEASSQ